jgi:hypothetical protein
MSGLIKSDEGLKNLDEVEKNSGDEAKNLIVISNNICLPIKTKMYVQKILVSLWQFN